MCNKVIGQKHDLILGVITKGIESEDVNHKAPYDYQISFMFNVKEITCEEVELIDSAIDHNHVTGEFRGVLCKQCNRALGMFHDSEKVLQNALEYLKMFGSYGGYRD